MQTVIKTGIKAVKESEPFESLANPTKFSNSDQPVQISGYSSDPSLLSNSDAIAFTQELKQVQENINKEIDAFNELDLEVEGGNLSKNGNFADQSSIQVRSSGSSDDATNFNESNAINSESKPKADIQVSNTNDNESSVDSGIAMESKIESNPSIDSSSEKKDPNEKASVQKCATNANSDTNNHVNMNATLPIDVTNVSNGSTILLSNATKPSGTQGDSIGISMNTNGFPNTNGVSMPSNENPIMNMNHYSIPIPTNTSTGRYIHNGIVYNTPINHPNGIHPRTPSVTNVPIPGVASAHPKVDFAGTTSGTIHGNHYIDSHGNGYGSTIPTNPTNPTPVTATAPSGVPSGAPSFGPSPSPGPSGGGGGGGYPGPVPTPGPSGGGGGFPGGYGPHPMPHRFPRNIRLNLWSTMGLDITYPPFAKELRYHSKYDTSSKENELWNLTTDRYRPITKELDEKARTCCLGAILSIQLPTGFKNVLWSASDVTLQEIQGLRNFIWYSLPPTVTDLQWTFQQDCRIKSSMLGSYLFSMLTESAKENLVTWKGEYLVKDELGEEHMDGATLWWCITAVVQPYSEFSVYEIQTKLIGLRISQFGHSVTKMLAKWWVYLYQIRDLGGDYSDSLYSNHFWNSVSSLDESIYRSFIENRFTLYMSTPRINRPTLREESKIIIRQESWMTSRKIWNKRSKPESQIMALATDLYVNSTNGSSSSSTNSNGGSGRGNSNRRNRNNNSSNNGNSNATSDQPTEFKYNKWKVTAPTDGITTQTRNNKEYHWCTKCREGKGLWARHSTENHKADYKSNNSTSSQSNGNNSRVTFQATTDGSPSDQGNNHDHGSHEAANESNQSSNNCSNGQVQVTNNLLQSIMKGKNCNSFISGFQKSSAKR